MGFSMLHPAFPEASEAAQHPEAMRRLQTASPSPLHDLDVFQAVASQASLSAMDVLRLTACCRTLRLHSERLPLNLTGHAIPAARLVTMPEVVRRFSLSLWVELCDQPTFDWIMALPALRELKLRRPAFSAAAQVSSLAAAAGATALRDLRLVHAVAKAVSDAGPLAHCTQLQSLALHSAAIADVSALSTCRSLTSLDLRHSAQLADLSGFARASCPTAWTLESLNLQHCPLLRDVSPITSLRRLRHLDLSRERQPPPQPEAPHTWPRGLPTRQLALRPGSGSPPARLHLFTTLPVPSVGRVHRPRARLTARWLRRAGVAELDRLHVAP